MNIFTPSQWLSQFLSTRGLNSVTGDALFTYQMKHEEYKALKNVVSQFYPKTNIGVSKHKEWAACFVICCSEWYRRDCDSLKWEWYAAWESLGFELSASQRADVIPLGLGSYWKRPIRSYESERRNFLGSVFIEGGLPFQLVSTKDNKFGDLIRKILRNYYKVDLIGVSLNELISSYLEYLPSVFTEDESIDLIAKIVRNLMGLADKIEISNQDDLPSEQLDQILPNWRSQFPIPLDVKTGKGLLDNWLIGASSASSSIKKYQSKLSCKHFFDLDSLMFSSEVSLPKLLNFYFKKSDVNSSKLDLGLNEGAKRRADFGSVFAQFETNRTVIKPRKKGVCFSRTNIDSSLFIELSELGVSVEQLCIENSSIALGEAPIGFVFEEDENKYICIGQASFTTKHKEIYVLVPSSYEVENLSGFALKDKDVEAYGYKLSWYKVSGDIRFYCSESRYRLRTNSSSNTSGMLAIVGDEVQWETKPAQVYKGVPEIKSVNEHADVNFGLTRLLDNKPVNTIKEYEKFGQHVFSVKNNDSDTLIRRKIAILPQDLSISFNSENESAVINVTTAQPIVVSLIAPETEIIQSKNDNTRCFTIKPNSLPPAKVIMQISANLLCDPIEIILPYPAEGIYGFDKDGNELPEQLTIHQLLGSEIYLFSNQDYDEKFELEFALKPIIRNSPTIFSSISVSNKPKVLSLYSFKEKIVSLLSLSDKLDAEVAISIKCRGYKKQFTVRRFASEVKFDPIDQLYSFESNAFSDEVSHNLLAMRIAEPECKPVNLPRRMLGSIELDRFKIAKEMTKGGPWLIIPENRTDIDFRPVFYFEDALDVADVKPSSSMQSAVKAFHPKFNPMAIADMMEVMANDYHHSSWLYMRSLWDNFGYLPLSTFEVFKALTKNLKALTIILFKFEMDEEFIRRLDTEFPVLWELIPLDYWHRAKNDFISSLEKIDIPADFIHEQVNSMFDRLNNAVPSYPEEVIKYIKSNVVSHKLPEAVLSIWLDDLKNDHSELDEKWPTNPKFDIENALSLLDGTEPMLAYYHKWQKSVVMYPIIAAAIASGKLDIESVFKLNVSKIFSLTQLRDFEPVWFSSMYSYFVSYFTQEV
ncbi:STY4851/ECs_5259 family protein [Thalassotalea profundi]|nr:STY4851/ECs_5259 family protein [Thalassotalea profundi]